ncbi:hypothetical protein BJN34_13360 [Cupriavidus necator]|uniref:MFS transporter n=1 Tax=Cupriavidus necator TaxID=106590 RepID=A0A1U9UQD6_CUPNE|nr:hypothetical protein [Cupriavidus necator]AQV94868.1 hypothetical protein BJN34_13360 [Cupriavidus necator]
MTTLTPPTRKSSGIAFVCAGLLWSLGTLIVNILPVVFQALHQSHGLSEDQLGALGTAFVLGTGITSASGPFWVYRSNLTWVSIGSLLVAALGLLGAAFLSDINNLTHWWFLIGLASGCISTPSFTALGYAANPLRAYSLAIFAALLIAALASFLLPLVAVPPLRDQGALMAIATLFVMATPCALALSRIRLQATSAPRALAGTSRKPARPVGYRLALAAPILAAVAGSVFTGVFMGGIYNFADAIATADGVPAQAVGPLVAMSLMGSLAGSILPSILGERIHTTVIIGVGTAVVVMTYPAMASHSTTVFCIGFIIHGIVATLVYTHYLGAVRRLDFTNRIYVAYPAMQALGLAVGTAFAGFLLARYTPALLLGVSAALVMASWLALFAAEKLSTRFSPPSFGRCSTDATTAVASIETV